MTSQSKTNSYDGTFPSITDVVSRHIDNLAVIYGNSSAKTYRALAFQVNQAVRRIEYINNLPTLTAGSTLGFGYFGENGHSADVNSPGDDLLRVGDWNDETIEEVAIAVQPDNVLFGIENPGDGSDVIGVQGDDNNRARGWDEDTLDERGGVRSQWSRTDDAIPTTASAPHPLQGHVVFDRDSSGDNFLRVGFQNDGDTDAPLQVTVMGMAYRVVPVNDKDMVQDIVLGDGHQRRVVQYGGFRNNDPTLPNGWQDGEVEIDARDVRGVLSGGSGP